MIEMAVVLFGMLLVTLLIHFVQHKRGMKSNFWKGSIVIYIICILGMVSMDARYFAAIIGYIVGCDTSKGLGWNDKESA